MNFLVELDNPLFLVLVGVALVIESVISPGLQFVSSFVGGGLIGWNIVPAIKGE